MGQLAHFYGNWKGGAVSTCVAGRRVWKYFCLSLTLLGCFLLYFGVGMSLKVSIACPGIGFNPTRTRIVLYGMSVPLKPSRASIPFALSSLIKDSYASSHAVHKPLDLYHSSRDGCRSNGRLIPQFRATLTPGKRKSGTERGLKLTAIGPTCQFAICIPPWIKAAVRCASKSGIISTITGNPLIDLSFVANSPCRRYLGNAAFSMDTSFWARSRFCFLSSAASFTTSSTRSLALSASPFACRAEALARCPASAAPLAEVLASPASVETRTTIRSDVSRISVSIVPILLWKNSSPATPPAIKKVPPKPSKSRKADGLSGGCITPLRKSCKPSTYSETITKPSTSKPTTTNHVHSSSSGDNDDLRISRMASEILSADSSMLALSKHEERIYRNQPIAICVCFGGWRRHCLSCRRHARLDCSMGADIRIDVDATRHP